MQVCHTLTPITKNTVTFDTTNPDHLTAFRMLCLGDPDHNGVIRQHPTLRFSLEAPFVDVRVMMFHKVATAHLELVGA